MRIPQLRLLLAIAETGSLRGSAERLHLTQPALTKALRQLEEELGARLVVRSAQGARLSPAGELLAARAAAALRELDRGREEVAAWAGGSQARVAVGVSPAAAVLLAPTAVAWLASRWPDTQIRLVDALYPRSLALVRSGELDFAVGPLPAERAERDLAVTPLFASPTIVVCRRGHPLVHCRSLAALGNAAWLLTGPVGGPGDPVSLGFDALGAAPPRVRIACESFSTLLAMVGEQDLICVMPRPFFERHGRRLGLARIPVRERLPVSTVHAVHRADAALTAMARRLLEAFVAAAQAVA